MKKIISPLAFFSVLLLTQVGCEPGIQINNIPDETPTSYTYSVSVEADVNANTNAPALQSFAHGVSGNEVLLFAGRTNRDSSDGGLHNMNTGNYASTSFIPKSYNTDLFVYDFSGNTVDSISYDTLLSYLVNNYCDSIDTDPIVRTDCKTYFTDNLSTLFKATNPISTQYNNTLYVLGGYGAIPGDPSTYLTYNQIASIDIPKMIDLVKNGITNFTKASDWQGLIQLGKDETNTLVSTGAEMFKVGPTIYLAGGHNFGSNQKYLDAVYPFTVTSDVVPYKLNVSVSNAISDVSDPKAAGSDTISKFRRRDGPVTPTLYKNNAGKIQQGLSFYGGVFTPATTAWQTAIYIHPGMGDSYTIDSQYNQKSQSVYACADLTGYDPTSSIVHTFLMGGVGNDTSTRMTGYEDSTKMLLGFTNNGVHIQFDVNGMTSAAPEVLKDVFPAGQNKLYGAESSYIPASDTNIKYIATGPSYNPDVSEIIDLNKTFNDSTNARVVGYVYGGIEAYQLNPGQKKGGNGYGPGYSAASNKIWKVTLTRTAE